MLPRVISEFIGADEQVALLEWARSQRPFLNRNGPGRNFKQLDLLANVLPLCLAISQRIEATLGIEPPLVEPQFRFYLSIIEPGGQIHRHTDKVALGYEHLRCNLFLQLPETGGMPIVEDEIYSVRERDLLYFTPNQHWHWCEPVGPGQRIILSYGYLVSEFKDKTCKT